MSLMYISSAEIGEEVSLYERAPFPQLGACCRP